MESTGSALGCLRNQISKNEFHRELPVAVQLVAHMFLHRSEKRPCPVSPTIGKKRDPPCPMGGCPVGLGILSSNDPKPRGRGRSEFWCISTIRRRRPRCVDEFLEHIHLYRQKAHMWPNRGKERKRASAANRESDKDYEWTAAKVNVNASEIMLAVEFRSGFFEK
ncbi:hypothetical protein BU16DRAFT_567612 [Lophium mytilinum]|uniref:Uncharacterized protein n=1 Tax=Lophium mytilinum TaxID=390894 RepID=A0A6A6QD93_9PEZI|nr:hypothetical protein BU16DRAFT_567612 [Lophium mytilinum]